MNRGIVERYRRLVALAESSNAHEAARAQILADRLAKEHELAAVPLRAFSPTGSVLVRDRPWWCSVLLAHAASYLVAEGIAMTDWRGRGRDMVLMICGPRASVSRVRLLYAGARAAIACGAASLGPVTLDEADAFCLAAAAAFGRNLAELHADQHEPRGTELVLWEPPPEPPALAPADLPESDRLAVAQRAHQNMLALLVRHRRAVERGIDLGWILGSRLDLDRPPPPPPGYWHNCKDPCGTEGCVGWGRRPGELLVTARASARP